MKQCGNRQNLCVFLFMCIISDVMSTYLYRVSPADNQMYPTGLYGGPVYADLQGQEGNLYASGYNRAEYDNDDNSDRYLTDLDMTSASYDPVSQKVLFQIANKDRSHVTVGIGRLCIGTESKPRIILGERYLTAETMASDNWDFFNLEDAGINCMAIYDSKIYFLLLGVYGSYGQYHEYIVKLELRLLDGCEDKLSKNTEAGLNILKCSKLIANVTEDSESKINWEKRTFKLKGSDMKIIKDASTDKLLFFFQVWKFKGHKIFLELYQASEEGLVSLLYTEEQAEESPVRTMGIDYKNGTICWSTSFSIKCAELRNGALSNLRTILDESDIRKVCKINATPSEYVTGVAITKRSNHAVNVYFGCQGNIAREGGLGMIIQGTSIADSRHEIYNVTSRGKKVLGSILFTSEIFPVTCATVVNYPDDGRTTSEGQKPVKNGTVMKCHTTTVKLAILVSFLYIFFNINRFY